MSNLEIVNTGSWIGLLTPILMIACFYFTLTFFESLRKEDERVKKQSKLAATICLALALLIPAVYNIYMYILMHR